MRDPATTGIDAVTVKSYAAQLLGWPRQPRLRTPGQECRQSPKSKSALGVEVHTEGVSDFNFSLGFTGGQVVRAFLPLATPRPRRNQWFFASNACATGYVTFEIAAGTVPGLRRLPAGPRPPVPVASARMRVCSWSDLGFAFRCSRIRPALVAAGSLASDGSSHFADGPARARSNPVISCRSVQASSDPGCCLWDRPGVCDFAPSDSLLGRLALRIDTVKYTHAGSTTRRSGWSRVRGARDGRCTPPPIPTGPGAEREDRVDGCPAADVGSPLGMASSSASRGTGAPSVHSHDPQTKLILADHNIGGADDASASDSTVA